MKEKAKSGFLILKLSFFPYLSVETQFMSFNFLIQFSSSLLSVYGVRPEK